MGLLDGLVEGVVGAELLSVVKGYVDNHGGLQGVVSQFEQHGLGETVQSWIGTGRNLPISGEQVQKVLGGEGLKHFAEKLGVPLEQVSAKLAQVLPHAVDTMTPGGTVPPPKTPA
jgi:uncharacterized protein YidB (DUF937 family)